MHCIFNQCKSSVTVLKFGHMSSDLLAYGASDGTLTVCSLSDEPSVLKRQATQKIRFTRIVSFCLFLPATLNSWPVLSWKL
ncbi:hypothetical protein Bca4012_077140 [Brassica carinata]